MANTPAHRLSRIFVRPLVNTPVTPNHLTYVRILTGIAACAAIGVGARTWEIVGGFVWILSTFLDRADGELARMTGKTSDFGHKLDYYADVFIGALFFLGVGMGMRNGEYGLWAPLMGLLACVSVAAINVLAEMIEKKRGDGVKAYESIGIFDGDDVFFLFAPMVWLGWHPYMLLLATVGAPAFALWTLWRHLKS